VNDKLEISDTVEELRKRISEIERKVAV